MHFSGAFFLLVVFAWADLTPAPAVGADYPEASQDTTTKDSSEPPLSPETSDKGAAGGDASEEPSQKDVIRFWSPEAAVTFCYKYAREALARLKREENEDNYDRLLGKLGHEIVSKFKGHVFELEIRGTKTPLPTSSSGKITTAAWDTQCDSCVTKTVTGKERDGAYSTIVILKFVEGQTTFKDPYPIEYEQKPLPPHLSAAEAQSFAADTAKDIALKLKKLGPDPGSLYTAVKHWTESLANYHSKCHFALEVQAGDVKHFPIVKTNGITSRWSGHTDRSYSTYAQGFVRQGTYQVMVRVYYVD